MMMGFGFLGMFLFWTALLALVVGSLVWVFRQTTGTRSSGDQRQPTARRVLDERFARGEISREEYEVVRARLEG
jgi:putative membrane protein